MRYVWGNYCEFDDVGEAIYYLISCTYIPILYASLNPRNSCVKILHTHSIVSLVLDGFGFNLEVVLYHICMRPFIWVLWCWGRNILFNTMKFHSHILFISKSKKLLCEKLALSCHGITSFHGFWLQSWSSFILDLYEG